MTIILTAVVLVLGLWLMFMFNGLVKLRNQVANGFRQIDVQLKRRHDLIPNLVNSVKGEMKFESTTLEKVIQARAAAINAGQTGNMNEILAKEGMLTQALGKLIALSENYPNLKSNESVKVLMEELTHTENQIGFARQFYNDIATAFNIKQQVVPNNMFASMMGFTPAALFELPADSPEKETPKVDLTIG
ncbi:MAG: LemA family protein [Elusimicrobia bacterium]|nr:LemA family protein [Elusimicrobiota bacterium]